MVHTNFYITHQRKKKKPDGTVPTRREKKGEGGGAPFCLVLLMDKEPNMHARGSLNLVEQSNKTSKSYHVVRTYFDLIRVIFLVLFSMFCVNFRYKKS